VKNSSMMWVRYDRRPNGDFRNIRIVFGDRDQEYPIDIASPEARVKFIDEFCDDSPDTLYMGLAVDVPEKDCNGERAIQEISGKGYERYPLVNVIRTGTWQNDHTITFNRARSSWGTPTRMFFADRKNGGLGDIVVTGNITKPQAIGEGDQVFFAPKDITVTWGDLWRLHPSDMSAR